MIDKVIVEKDNPLMNRWWKNLKRFEFSTQANYYQPCCLICWNF